VHVLPPTFRGPLTSGGRCFALERLPFAGCEVDSSQSTFREEFPWRRPRPLVIGRTVSAGASVSSRPSGVVQPTPRPGSTCFHDSRGIKDAYRSPARPRRAPSRRKMGADHQRPDRRPCG